MHQEQSFWRNFAKKHSDFSSFSFVKGNPEKKMTLNQLNGI
jgi:hypothetical protein